MTPDEMRLKEESSWDFYTHEPAPGDAFGIIAAAIWGVGAEICQRLDRIADQQGPE